MAITKSDAEKHLLGFLSRSYSDHIANDREAEANACLWAIDWISGLEAVKIDTLQIAFHDLEAGALLTKLGGFADALTDAPDDPPGEG